jgi:surfactin synthase thioesterase subunit
MSYRGLVSRLPAQVELLAAELPGHGQRYREPPAATMAELVDGLITEILPLRGPLAIYGHSMGALVGLELARAIRARQGRSPAALLVASSDCPAAAASPAAVGGLRPLDLSDADWRATLRDLGGVDDPALTDPHVLDMLMSALHGDLVLLDSYRYRVDRPLGCAVRVYAGTSDPTVTEAGLAAWRAESPRDFEVVRLPGGHFFPREQLFLARLGYDLQAICAMTNGVAR